VYEFRQCAANLLSVLQTLHDSRRVTLSYNTSLPPDKEAAIEEHALLNDATQIYCDGSGYRGHIGAAAIYFSEQVNAHAS